VDLFTARNCAVRAAPVIWFFEERAWSHEKAAADDSWTRVMKFFGEQIGGQKAESRRA
jgi:dienelactone hydrolase